MTFVSKKRQRRSAWQNPPTGADQHLAQTTRTLPPISSHLERVGVISTVNRTCQPESATTALQSPCCPRSSGDRALASGAGCAGSNPAEGARCGFGWLAPGSGADLFMALRLTAHRQVGSNPAEGELLRNSFAVEA